MRKLYIFGLVAIAALIIGLAYAEQITFSTYYPAPHGVYREMNVNYILIHHKMIQFKWKHMEK